MSWGTPTVRLECRRRRALWVAEHNETQTMAARVRTGVMAAMLAERARGYAGPGFSDPRRVARTPSASTDSRRG